MPKAAQHPILISLESSFEASSLLMTLVQESLQSSLMSWYGVNCVDFLLVIGIKRDHLKKRLTSISTLPPSSESDALRKAFPVLRLRGQRANMKIWCAAHFCEQEHLLCKCELLVW